MDKKTAEQLSQENAEALLQAMKKLSSNLHRLSENLEQTACEIEDEEARKFQHWAVDIIERIKAKSKA